MPREWHDRHAVNQITNPDQRRFYLSIVADKKPYFMKYIYPALMKQYNTYIKNTNKNALREFNLSIDELLSIPEDQLSERQSDFLRYYKARMPVGNNDCVMNKICRKFEERFDGYIGKHNQDQNFDYTIMKSNDEYTKTQYNEILKLYSEYNKKLQSYSIFAQYEKIDEWDSVDRLSDMKKVFTEECAKICPNKSSLCNIVLDICYRKNATRKFAWDMCGEQIITNLLNRHNGFISYPVIEEDGIIEFSGNKFNLHTTNIMEVDDIWE